MEALFGMVLAIGGLMAFFGVFFLIMNYLPQKLAIWVAAAWAIGGCILLAANNKGGSVYDPSYRMDRR